jgi:hypothetical protein
VWDHTVFCVVPHGGARFEVAHGGSRPAGGTHNSAKVFAELVSRADTSREQRVDNSYDVSVIGLCYRLSMVDLAT